MFAGATLDAFWRSAMPTSIKYFPLFLALAALPVSAQTVRVYVTNSAGDNIHVIDPATNKVVQVINGVEAAHGIDFSPDGQRVYVSNEADSTLDVIDRASGKTMTKVRLSGHPNNISATKDGARVVVGIAEDPGALDVIDARALKLARTIPVNGRLHNVYVTTDNKHVVTGSIRSKVLTVIDLKTDQIAWELKLDEGVRPMTIEVNPDGSTRRIFAQLSNFNGFAVVDFAARREVARVKLPDEPGGFGVIERRTDAPSHGIGFAPDSRLLYISNAGARSVSAIDTRTLKSVATIPVGEVPKRINTLVLP